MIVTSQRKLIGISALLFAGSAALTIAWCSSMAGMAGMAMPGDWTMSMAWMRMPGQSWSDAALTFIGMWVVMMVAMMLPSLVPMLLRYRRAVCCADPGRLAALTMLVGLGYFSVWAALGVVVFPLGVVLATVTMQLPVLSHAVPMTAGAVVVVAGALQFSAWKARHLACCRDVSCPGAELKSSAATAWRFGARLGVHCTSCCAGLTAILLVIGVMDLRAMALVAVAITLERLAPAGQRVARVIGAVVVAGGLGLMVRAGIALG